MTGDYYIVAFVLIQVLYNIADNILFGTVKKVVPLSKTTRFRVYRVSHEGGGFEADRVFYRAYSHPNIFGSQEDGCSVVSKKS